jgi:O-antigen/teichoic acid export membrane protein
MYLIAPWIAESMYRLPELTALIRYLCPAVLLMSLGQVLSGMIAGLGRQKQSLYGSLIGAGVTLLLSWFLTGDPAMRLYGAALSNMVGQGFGVAWSFGLLILIMMKKAPPKGRENDQPPAKELSDT